MAEQEAKVEAAPPAARRPAKPPKRNRGSLPAHLPQVEVVVDIADKTCGCCGAALHTIGKDRSEMLVYVPTQICVQVICRPRYGCRACKSGVVLEEAGRRNMRSGPAQSMGDKEPPAPALGVVFLDDLTSLRSNQGRADMAIVRHTAVNVLGRP